MYQQYFISIAFSILGEIMITFHFHLVAKTNISTGSVSNKERGDQTSILLPFLSYIVFGPETEDFLCLAYLSFSKL